MLDNKSLNVPESHSHQNLFLPGTEPLVGLAGLSLVTQESIVTGRATPNI